MKTPYFDVDGNCPICANPFKGLHCPHSFNEANEAGQRIAERKSARAEHDDDFVERIAREITAAIRSGVAGTLDALAGAADGVLDPRFSDELRRARDRFTDA